MIYTCIENHPELGIYYQKFHGSMKSAEEIPIRIQLLLFSNPDEFNHSLTFTVTSSSHGPTSISAVSSADNVPSDSAPDSSDISESPTGTEPSREGPFEQLSAICSNGSGHKFFLTTIVPAFCSCSWHNLEEM